MGRFSSHELYEEDFDNSPTRSPRESYAALGGDSDDVATRFARPSAPAITDSDEVETRYNHLVADSDAIETRFAKPVAPVFVAPAEIEGERSPAMRARRQSYVAPSEHIPPPPRPSHAELERRKRASFVANSERNDFASSVPDVEEVTSHREPRPSFVRADSVDGHYSSSEIEEIQPPPPSIDRKVRTAALSKFLFEDIAAASKPLPLHKTTNPAFPPPPHASSFLPPSQQPRKTNPQFAPQQQVRSTVPVPAFKQQQVHGDPAHLRTVPSAQALTPPKAFTPAQSFTPPARVSPSGETPVAPLMPRQQMHTGMQQMPRQDSYIDSSWIVPTPPYSQPAPPRAEEGFKFSMGFLAAAITAAAALIVVIGAVIFVRSDEASMPMPMFTMKAPVVSTDGVAAAQPLPAAPATNAATPFADTTPAPKSTTPSQLKDAPKAKPAPAKKKAAVVAASDDDDVTVASPVPTTKPAPKAEKAEKPAPEKTAKKSTSSKVGDKTVEQMLADLGDEQLRR